MSIALITMIKHQIFWTSLSFPLFLFLFKYIVSDYVFNLTNARKIFISGINEEIKNNLQETENYQNKMNLELFSYNEKIENYINLNLNKEHNNWKEILENEKNNINSNVDDLVKYDEYIDFNYFCNMLYEKLEK